MIRFASSIYVHSYVVGKAAKTLAEIIMNEEPTFFDDIDFIQKIQDAEKRNRTYWTIQWSVVSSMTQEKLIL